MIVPAAPAWPTGRQLGCPVKLLEPASQARETLPLGRTDPGFAFDFNLEQPTHVRSAPAVGSTLDTGCASSKGRSRGRQRSNRSSN
jgi:hypothetical protein